MSTTEGFSKKMRIALGVMGFLFLTASMPCILIGVREGYAGTDDMVGLFGLGGLVLLVVYVGVLLLYQAFKTPTQSDTKKL